MDTFVPSTLFAYRTKRHNTTQHEPFYLTYGREVTLPIEFQVQTQNTQAREINDEDNLLNRVGQITGRIDHDINQAQSNIEKSQRKQKEGHDRNLTNEYTFKVGELVLMHKTELQDKKKLEKRWKGPYYIHADLGNGVYKLRTIDRKILKVPINGARLKKYHQRTLPELIVLIEN